MQVWEHARQQVALPPGYGDVITLGGELSLWDPFVTRWLAWMRKNHPDAAVRAEIATAGQLLEHVLNGAVDLVVLHNPQKRAGPAISARLWCSPTWSAASSTVCPRPRNSPIQSTWPIRRGRRTR